MKALPDTQQVFVMACINMGVGLNYTEAARIAGYANTPTIKVTAHKLAHDEKIQAAIQEQNRRTLRVGTLEAVAYLLETVRNTKAETKDRLKAAQMVLDRGGLHALSEHQVTVNHNHMSVEEKAKRVRDWAVKQGIDPDKLLGSLINDGDKLVQDVEFEMVKEE